MAEDKNTCVIIDDEDNILDDEEETIGITPIYKKPVYNEVRNVVIKKEKKIRNSSSILNKYFYEDINIVEVGLDEAGRGPMLGRVYAGAVILPKDDSFNHSLMKDSKKFHSKKKIEQVAEYIKENALAWTVEYETGFQ